MKAFMAFLLVALITMTTGTAFATTPTLTKVNKLFGAWEDTQFSVSYAAIKGAADESANTQSFKITGVASGTLWLANGTSQVQFVDATHVDVGGTVYATTGVYLSSSGVRIDDGTQLSTAASVKWQAAQDYSGDASIVTIRASSAIYGGDISAGDVAVTVRINAVNDPPYVVSGTLSGAETYEPGVTLDFVSDFVVADIDNSRLTVTFVLSDPAAGSLSTAQSGITMSTYDAATGTWQASGPIADVNILTAGLTYVPAAGYTSDFAISVAVSDGIAAALTGTKLITCGN